MMFCVNDISPDERADIARLLFKAGYAVRPVKVRKHEKSTPFSYIDFWDDKEVKRNAE